MQIRRSFQKAASKNLDEMLGGVVDQYGQSKIPLAEANALKGKLDKLLYGMKGEEWGIPMQPAR